MGKNLIFVPLKAYEPAVILTQLQIKDIEKTLEVDKPEFGACRSLLCSGPATSLRVNIRAVAQYALGADNGKTAFSDVDQCLRALEKLDSLLLHASRNDQEASVKSVKANIGTALSALDSCCFMYHYLHSALSTPHKASFPNKVFFSAQPSTNRSF